jgi:hypothetical protein
MANSPILRRTKLAGVLRRAPKLIVALGLGMGVLVSGCGIDPCEEYGKVYEKAWNEGAFDKYQDSLESWQRQCVNQY